MFRIISEDVLSGETFECVLGDKEFETKEEAIQYAIEDMLNNYESDLEEEGITEEAIRAALIKDDIFEFENWSGNTYSYEIEEI